VQEGEARQRSTVTAHVPSLDGVRGIAILLVLFHHFTLFDPVTSIGAWFGFFALLGWSGVDLFFVLSGFLITGILLDARGSGRYFSSFYMRRVLRIFPLYYLVVALSFVVLPQFPRWHELLAGRGPYVQWPYWTYLVNFAIAERGDFTHGVLDVAWSLAIEEQFYLLWPAVVWLLRPAWLGALCLGIVVGVPVLRWIALDAGVEPVDTYVLPYYRADALAMGALLAWLRARGQLDLLRGAGPWVFVGGAAGAVACAVAAGGAWWWEPLTQRIGYSMFAIAGAGLVIVASTWNDRSVLQRMLRVGWLRAFGKYSYAIYLLHLPVSRVLQEFVMTGDEFPTILGAVWPAQLLYYVMATAPTFALAWLSWRFFEAPILRLKSRFPYAEEQAVRAP
jgi:peptidoglycan/LPS O-acetylase OafA/YrhL